MNEKGSRWHQSTPLTVCQSLHTNAACGLSRKAARSRLKKQGRNSLFDDIAQKKRQPIRELLLDPAILLMLFSALLTIIFMPILQVVITVVLLLLLVCALLYFLYRCETLARITAQYRTPTVRVLRDSRILTVSAARVVVGDILLLHTGDIVPGDCRLLTSQQLRVLTLQPDSNGHPIYKEYAKNADATYPYGSRVDAPMAENMLYGGSEILCGEAKVVLVAVGEASYLGAMRSFTLPAEIGEQKGETPTQKMIAPYLRLWGFFALVFLTVMTVVGLFTKPADGGLAEYFFILCILIGASSPAVFSLYLHWISVRGRLLCMENDPPKNRAIIKSEAGIQRLAGITDLFVVGKRGLCDGVTHFWSAFVRGREIRVDEKEYQDALNPLCEAMLLRHEADLRAPTYGYAQNEESDAAFLSEMIAICGFDRNAMLVRLKGFERGSYQGNAVWKSVIAQMQEGTIRFLFDNSGTLMRRCVLYQDGKRMRAITEEYRKTLSQYVVYVEENGCRTLCVARECDGGTLALVGVLALREQVSAVLPSVVEELSQSGVRTRFFLSEDDYARVCRLPKPYIYCSQEHPNLTSKLLQDYRTFIGFSKEELSTHLPLLRKSGSRVAVLCGNADDRLFLRSGVLTLACDTVNDLKFYAEDRITEAMPTDGQEGSRNASQTLRRHSDIIIERADRFAGGVYAALQAVSHSREVDLRTRMLLQFCFYSQLARFVMVFLSVCTGIGLFSSVQMLLSGFVVEIAALCFLSDVPVSQSSLRRPSVLNQTFLSETLLSRKAILSALIPVVLTTLTVIVLTIAGVLPKDAAKTCLFLSLLLLQITMLCCIVYKAKTQPEIKKILPIGGILLGGIALLTLLSFLITSFGIVTGMGAWTVLSAILLLFTPAAYLILTVLIPFLSRTAK